MGPLDQTMGKTLTLAAAMGLSLGCLVAIASAAAQAPVGHRQPSAADVPANDSVRGDAGLAGPTTTTTTTTTTKTKTKTKTKRKRSRRVQSNVDVIMKTPNICSNCNQ
jgi:hypothetical protein